MESLKKPQVERIRKAQTMLFIMSIPFAILFIALFYNQILKHPYYAAQSQSNQMHKVRQHAQRGKIMDRNSVVLVRNVPSYNLNIIPFYIRGARNKEIRDSLFSFISQLTTFDGQQYITREDIDTIWARRASSSPFEEITIIENMDALAIAVVEEHSYKYPGIIISSQYKRYSASNSMSHITGYIDEITAEALETRREFYQKGDKIGKTGIENQHEQYLRGKDGFYYVEVNAFGKILGVMEHKPHLFPTKGKDVVLTIDYRLQNIIYEEFPDTLKGAFVVIDPANGQILAMYSQPNFDPNIFNLSSMLRNQEWQLLVADTNRPLNNRAISGQYPPGSTFKIITALAGLSTVENFENFTSFCRAVFRFGNRNFRCWEEAGHGRMNLIESIQRSCNVFYYQWGITIGIDAMTNMAFDFGFGRLTGIDLPGERGGEILTPELYNRRFRSRGWVWTGGMVLNSSIGQGGTVTPLQLANFAAGLANGQYLYRPHITKKIVDDNGKTVFETIPEVINILQHKRQHLDIVIEGMDISVNQDGGTARQAQMKTARVVGKTGTSQTIPGRPTTGLFFGFAQGKSDTIAFSCIVEEGGGGGGVAAPIVGRVLRRYFNEVPEAGL